ncbi:MAG: nitrogen fixation protein NifB [Lachnospiraceae bacterium]|nr:nitrogen fixation protein NifB [Lachnospiraceae bacterium]
MAKEINKELYKEIQLKNELLVEGVSFEPDIFQHASLGDKVSEQVNAMFNSDKEAHVDNEFPACIISPKGHYRIQLRWIRKSPYKLNYEDGRYLIRKGHEIILDPVVFSKRPDYYNKKTSDGAWMRTVAQDNGHGVIFIPYSNECALKDSGKDCLFCNINATRALYAEKECIAWKTADQIAETVKECYGDGYEHLTISGGFIPERREVDYYVDVAESITETLGKDSFNGTACVGAPLDFSVFEKYKEAGFSTIATNLEIWDEGLFDLICPGKKDFCGGRQNWLDALDEELRVFGKHKVRSAFVAGIEPKPSLLEGVQHLIEKGVIALPNQWYVNVGSALEGCRTPEPEWHWDVYEKTVGWYRKNGVTWDEFRNATAASSTVLHDLFRLYEDIPLMA